MRLWSLHPQYFDRQALTAAWREALLAQAVLREPARGYGRHPQLERFREQTSPLSAIGQFLTAIADEADRRGYNFTRAKILEPQSFARLIPVTTGQLQYEWSHLMAKLEHRSPDVASRWIHVASPEPHPLFTTLAGAIASWERPKG